MKTVVTLAILVALGAYYWYRLRPLLRTKPELQAMYARLDLMNASVWECVLAKVDGWKTIIFGVFGALWLLLPELLQQLVGIPWTELGLSEAWSRIIGGAIYVAMIMTHVSGGGSKPEPEGDA